MKAPPSPPAPKRLTPEQRELVRWLVRALLDRQQRAHVSVARQSP